MGKLNAEQIAAAHQRKAAGGPYTRTELGTAVPPGAEPWYTERRHPTPVIIDVYTGAEDVPQMGRISRRARSGPSAYVIEIED